MFHLVLAHSGSPGKRAVKQLCRDEVDINTEHGILFSKDINLFKILHQSILEADGEWSRVMSLLGSGSRFHCVVTGSGASN